MNTLQNKLKEALQFLSQQPATQFLCFSMEFLRLKSWAESSATSAEPVTAIQESWRTLMSQANMAIQVERNKVEEEKRRWSGFANPYLKKVAEFIELKQRELDQQKMISVCPTTACFLREVGENSLSSEAPSFQKSRYTFERRQIDNTVALFNQEHLLQTERDIQDLKVDIYNLRKELLSVFESIPAEKLSEVTLRHQPRAGYDMEIDEDRYSADARAVKTTHEILMSTLVKALRAPTIVLMTGAFVYSILAQGSLRDVFNAVILEYPILVWLFMACLLGYFSYDSRKQIRHNAEEQRTERGRIWTQVYNQLRSDIKNLFSLRKNDVKTLYSTLREAEADWFIQVLENHIQPDFERRANPVLIATRYLSSIDMEIPRLITEAQRSVDVKTLNNVIHKN